MTKEYSTKPAVTKVKVPKSKHVSRMTRDEALKAVSNGTLENDVFEDYFPDKQ